MAAEATDQSTAPGDLLIVGSGVLGTYLATQWQARGGRVTGRTKTSNNHDKLRSFGIKTETIEEYEDRKYPYVVFSAPPSGSDDYPSAVKASLDFWDKSGSFVFTSSIGVLPKTGYVNEDTPPADPESVIAKAQAYALEGEGNVAILAGLYHSLRGPHTFLFRRGKSGLPPNFRLNLIHYQDVANLILEVLLKGEAFRSQIFLATYPTDLTIEEIISLSRQSGLFSGEIIYEKEALEKVSFRDIDNSRTRELLDNKWSPNFSFESLMASGGKDWYFETGMDWNVSKHK